MKTKKSIMKLAFVLGFMLMMGSHTKLWAQSNVCRLNLEALMVDTLTGQPVRDTPMPIKVYVSPDSVFSSAGYIWFEEPIVRTDKFGRFSFVLGAQNIALNPDNFCFSVLARPEAMYVHILDQNNRWFYTTTIGEVPYAFSAEITPEAEDFPVGSILAYGAGGAAPANYVRSVGSQSVDTSSALGRVIGFTWGKDGSTRGNLPAIEGVFLRGVSGTSGRDPGANDRGAFNAGGATGNKVGSYQGDLLGKHIHPIDMATVTITLMLAGNNNYDVLVDAVGNDPIETSFLPSVETRPKNAAVNFIIKTQP